MLDTGLSVDGRWPWLLLVPLLGWFVHQVYRRTRPQVPSLRARWLWLLRTASLTALVLLLVEPTATFLARRVLRPVIVTLVDTSPSMAVDESGQTRLGRALDTVSGPLAGHRRGGPILAFADRVYPVSADTLAALRPTGHASDLASALSAAAAAAGDPRLMAGALLLSDGRHNLGGDPVAAAGEAGFPVFALGLGSQDVPPDIQVATVEAADVIVAGHPVELTVGVRSWGHAGNAATLQVLSDERELARQEVSLGEDGQLLQVAVSLPPLDPGPHLLKVSARTAEGDEVNQDNNQLLAFVRVHRERLRVLMVTGSPGPETAFIRRALVADSMLAVEALVRRDWDGRYYGGGTFPTSGREEGWDALALVDPGPDLLTAASAAWVDSFVQRGGGLLVVAGPRTLEGWLPDAPLARLLPVVTGPDSRSTPAEGPLAAPPAGRLHPALRSLSETPGSGEPAEDPWLQLPPLVARLSGAGAAPGATVLLQCGPSSPVVVAASRGAGHVVAAMGSGFWRVSLLGSGVGEQAETVGALWRDAVRWLAVADPVGRVRASAERQVYRAGEEAVVAAEVFDALNEPLAGAQVEVDLKPSGRTGTLEAIGAGRYRMGFAGLEPGEHAFQVVARHDGKQVGQDQGRFVVETHTVEGVDLRADPELLAAIARASGGDYRPLDRWEELADRLRVAPTLIREERSAGVGIEHTWLMAVVVALVSLEWLIRKRSGML